MKSDGSTCAWGSGFAKRDLNVSIVGRVEGWRRSDCSKLGCTQCATDWMGNDSGSEAFDSIVV